MASAVDSQKLMSVAKITHYRKTGSTAHDTGWVSMDGYEGIVISICTAALTGTGPTAFSILANTESDGSGTDVTIKSHAMGSLPDAVGDYVFLSVTAAEIVAVCEAAGYNPKGISASVTQNNSSDVYVATYIRYPARHSYDDLTADYVSA